MFHELWHSGDENAIVYPPRAMNLNGDQWGKRCSAPLEVLAPELVLDAIFLEPSPQSKPGSKPPIHADIKAFTTAGSKCEPAERRTSKITSRGSRADW